MQRYFILLGALLLSLTVFAQDPPKTVAEFEKNYQARIKKEMIKGVYIPADLTEAFVELNKKISAKSRAKLRSAPEELVVKKTFFSFGRWMSYNWGFYEGSRLSHFVKESVGISHPEDISKFLIITYVRNLKKEPLKVKEVAAKIKAERKKEIDERRGIISKGQ